MNATLSEYVQRAEQLSTPKSQESKDELRTMISFLEHTLKVVKGSYNNNIIEYDEDINQYYCNIDGIELRGNIGKIYDKRMLRNEKIKAHQVVYCKYRNKCKNILQQKYCKFYHDPVELQQLLLSGTIKEPFYKETIKYTRNFANTSWMYSSLPRPYMRNLNPFNIENTLLELKLKNLEQEEIETYKAQVIHDLLILKLIGK